MKATSKKVLESECQVLVSKSSYDTVKVEIATYDETTIENLIALDAYSTLYECYLKATLFYVKKNKKGKERIVKYKTKKKDKVEALLFLLILLVGKNWNSVTFIIGSGTLKAYAMAF